MHRFGSSNVAVVGLVAVALAAGVVVNTMRPAADLPSSKGRYVIEHQANLFSDFAQQDAALDRDGRGNTLVAWSSRRQEAGTYGVFARMCDAWGRPINDEIHPAEPSRACRGPVH